LATIEEQYQAPSGRSDAASSAPVGQAHKEEVGMKGYRQDIEGIAVKNEDFRQVLCTAKNCQLVVMNWATITPAMFSRGRYPV
jgi:hypothetical protein